jgi:hypothetical protein
VTLSSLRRRWPEAALLAALALLAVVSGALGRSVAVVLVGGVAVFAIRRRVRDVVLGIALVVAFLLAAVAVTVTVDLGQVFDGKFKQLAEREGSKALERPLHIGRLGIHIARGRFIVENLVIEGRAPSDAPFFRAKRVSVDFPWWRVVATREFFIRSVEMSDWAMEVEKDAHGNNLPRLQRSAGGSQGPRRFTTTVFYLHAYRGRFTYIDHGNWRTTANNLDVYLRHDTGDYLGTATITDGSVQIKDYEPMRLDMRAKYKIDGAVVRLPEILLDTDGSHSVVNGQVDFGHWPEMIYHVDSRLDLWRMREIYFPHESWRARGEARFVGTFHVFNGGHLLKGDFSSPLAHVDALAFPDLHGSLEWEPHRFEIADASARFCSGDATFRFLMAPLSDPRPGVATWRVNYRNVDLAQLSDTLRLRGLRMLGRASGENLLEWPLGRFSEHRGSGRIVVVPPSDRPVLTREPRPEEAAIHALAPAYGPERDLSRFPAPTPVGGELTYRFDPEWLYVSPSHLATGRTYVEFEGRTAYGTDSRFPFYARSADWQESDRVMAGVLTAFGSPTGVILVGGYGEFRGTMTKAFRGPLIQGDFAGDQMRAWDVVWGHATARVSIENSYVDIANGLITRGDSSIDASGRFSLGYPRKDGREEFDARFEIRKRPIRDLRHAFQLDDWPLNGLVSGGFHLRDRYAHPIGSGSMQIVDADAWDEPLDRADVRAMEFDGRGVWLTGIEIRKGRGVMRGAAHVGWDGTYSFDISGEHIALADVALIKYGRVAWSGDMHFKASGTATFAHPHYAVQMGASGVAFGDQPIGAVEMGLDVQDRVMGIEQLEAAALGVSGHGKIEMSPTKDAELTFRFNRTLLDPYVRLYVPKLSDYTKAEVSGTVDVIGQLADWNRLYASATIENLRLKLLDYELRNDGPMRLTFEDNVIRVDPATGAAHPGLAAAPGAAAPALRLRSDNGDTQLALSGDVDLKAGRLDVKMDGKANLAVLQAFSRNVRSSGGAVLHGTVSGSLAQPEFAGYAQITDGRFRHLSLPQSIQAINGRVSFGQDGIAFDDVKAQVAGGKVVFSGRAEIRGFALGALELHASGRRMEFRYPAGFRSTIDADFDLLGTVSAPIVRGTVTVLSALYDKRIDITPGFLALASGRSSVPSGPSSGQLPPIRLDVHIVAPSSLRIENNIAHLVANADLWLRGTYDHPQLSGGADVERGEVLVMGQRYLVRRGRIEFPDPNKLEPFFDLGGETLVRVPGQTYVINVELTGTTASVTPTFTSDPPLSQVEILSLLFGNQTATADVTNAEINTLQQEDAEKALATSQLQQAAAGVVSAPITKAVEQTFGLDTFQITPNVGYEAAYQRLSPTARVTVGKRISNKLYLTYSRSLNTPGGADQVVILEYDQSDRLSWIFSRNEDGTYAIDVRVRHVF